MIAPGPDVLRFVALPIFAYVAVTDLRTRRVPGWVWYPVVALGVLALGWEGARTYGMGGFAWTLWTIRVGISVGIVAPMGYLFWRIGAFGLADAKAVVSLGILFPTYPSVAVGSRHLPLIVSDVGVFSLTILVNAVIVGLCYPLVLAAINASRGRFRPTMFVGIPVEWVDLDRQHGKLLEGADGFTRYGVDLDALRMYLRWRGTTLADVRRDPAGHRDPASLPDKSNHPGDGRVETDGGRTVGPDDPWGARTFVAETGGPYGTRPEELRAALTLVVERDRIWVSPGIPFLVPLALGLLVALTYGDLLTTALAPIGF